MGTRQRNQRVSRSVPEKNHAQADAKGRGALLTGCVLLAVCVGAAAMLSLEHLMGISLPGCGQGSPCAEAAASAWGRVPGMGWPVAYLGLAWFVAMLVAWLLGGGRLGAARNLVRLGAVASVGFIAAMVVGGYLCNYCLVTHVANLLFWLLVEWRGAAEAAPRRGLVSGVLVFVAVTGLVGVADQREHRAATARAETKLAGSLERLTGATATSPAEPPTQTRVVESPVPASGPAVASRPARFEGRYRLGPEKAAIRVVVFSDYQCHECRRIEGELLRLVRQRDDMALSIKHFPMCADCNRRVKRSMHPNACWAARAAEAAGILRGNEAFWAMHEWLFAHKGAFTRSALREALRAQGYDIRDFERTMTGEETLARVKRDVEEGIGLGVWFTPTIYINGVELRGWEAPRAIPRAIEAISASHPPPRTAAADHPVPAMEKLIGDWREGRRLRIPPAPAYRALGAGNARVRICVWGDLRHPGTAEVDALIRELLAERGDLRYEYHDFPFNKECNPAVRKATKYPDACRAAYVVRAAGRLGGATAYWAMHRWMFAHQGTFDTAAIQAAATGAGLDAEALWAEAQTPEVHRAVIDDARAGRRLGATSVPTIFINGRKVPRWKLDDRNILRRIVAAAAAENEKPQR